MENTNTQQQTNENQQVSYQKEWPKLHDDSEVYKKEIKPLIDLLHQKCVDLGLPLIASVSYGQYDDGNNIGHYSTSLAITFPAKRTPIEFRMAENAINGDDNPLAVFAKLFAR